MDILGLDIGKFKFDAFLLQQGSHAHAAFPNTQTGFEQLRTWLAARSLPEPAPLHACLEATGNYGLDLAAFLFAEGVTVSIVNPKQIKAFGDSELTRNKTDPLDAALIARFCRAHTPPAWTPPLAHMRALRETVRRCAALKEMRTQEINRQKAGFASDVVNDSIQRLRAHIEGEIETLTAQIRDLLAQDKTLQGNFDLLRSIPGIGDVTAALLLAELPNIAEFTPKGLAAFAGLSPAEHSSGARHRGTGISRIGNAAIRSAMYLCALSARRHNPRLQDFVARMQAAGKPNKVILVAIARKLLVMAHAVIRTQKSFVAVISDEATAPN
jgi:transposase